MNYHRISRTKREDSMINCLPICFARERGSRTSICGSMPGKSMPISPSSREQQKPFWQALKRAATRKSVCWRGYPRQHTLFRVAALFNACQKGFCCSREDGEMGIDFPGIDPHMLVLLPLSLAKQIGKQFIKLFERLVREIL